MNDNYIVDFLSALDQKRSQKQVNSDIKTLEKTINKLRLTATLAQGSSKKELNAYIKTLSNQLSTIKLKAQIDSKNLKSEINSALSKVSFKDIDILNIDGNKTKLKVQKVIADAKAYTEKNPISIGINYENRRNKLDNDLTGYLNRNSKINESSVLLNEANKVRELIGAINDKKSLSEATDSFRLFKSEVASTGYNTQSTTDKIKSMLGHVTKIGSAFGIASTATKQFVNSAKELKEIDSLLTEISKANEKLSKSDLNKIGDSSFGVASRYGRKATDYLSGVQEASRAGYGNATDIAELSVAAQGAGDLTSKLANQYLIATDKAYKFGGSVEKLTEVLDGSNYITNNNAVNMRELSEAMTIVGSTAASFGVDVDKTTAALGTMIATTQQSGSEVARAFKAILLNIRQVSDEEEGIDAEGLTKYESACNALNVKLKETKDGVLSLRDPMEVLRDLSIEYNKLEESDIRRTELLSSVGGKLRATQLDALLRQWDTYETMLQQYAEGTGSMAVEAEKTAKSLEGRLNSLSNSFTSFVNTITNKDVALNGISFFDKMIQGAEKLVNMFGEIPVIMTTFSTAMTALNKDFGITQIINPETKKLDLEGNLGIIDFSAIKKQKMHFEEAKEAIGKWNGRLKAGKTDIEKFEESVVQNNASLKAYLQTTSKDAPASLNEYRDYLQKTGQAAEDLRLKTILLNTALTFIGGIAVQAVITGIANAFDKFNETVEESKEAVDGANSKISDLKSQIEELNSLEYKSDFDKQKISQLERELELQEKILEVEQKRLYQNQIGTKFSGYFDADSLATKQITEEDRYNKESFKYLSVRFKTDKESLADVEAELSSLQERLNNGLAGHEKFQVEGQIEKLTEKRNKLLEEQQSIEEQLIINSGEYLKNYQAAQEAVDSGLLTGKDLEKAESMAEYWNQMYQDSSDIVTNIQKIGGRYDNTNDLLEEKFGGISRDDLASLSDDDKRIALSFDSNNTIGFEELQKQIAETKGDIEGLNATEVKTFDQAWADSFTSENDAVKELANSLLELAEQGRLTKETFNEADSTDYFKNLGISADEAVLKINKLVDESKQLSSMASQISSMAEALGTKQENGFVEADTLAGFDVEVRGLESWDRFQEVLGSTASSYEECQEAANALATEWVNSSDFLAQLTEQNEEYYKTQLDSMGIENYEEVISYAHALNEAKEVLMQSSLELGNATYDEIEALIAEGTYSELTAGMILALYDAKIAEQAATLDTSADCANLIALAGDTDRTSQSIQLLIQLMDIYSGLESGAYNGNRVLREEALTEVNRIKSELEKLANGETEKMEIEPTVKLGNRGKSSAKSAGKDAGKSYKEGFEEELNNIEGVISGITGKIDDQITTIKSQKEAALEAIDAEIDALNEQKSALEAQKKALEEERDARIEIIEQQKKQLELAIKNIDKQIKAKEKIIDGINDEIKAMQDANEQRKRAIDLQKAQYELERLQHQRTILLYSEEKGMHYVNDSKNIRDAKDKVDDAKLEIEIANKQKEIDLIEKEIDLLNEKKDAINEQIDILDEQIDQIKEFYDAQIKAIDTQIEAIDRQIEALQKQKEETESYYESLIQSIEKSKSKYEELTDLVKQAELSAALKGMGIDEEALLNGSEEEFEKLKNAYLDIVFKLNEGNEEVLSSLKELSGYDGTAPSVLSESTDKLVEMNGQLDTSNQNISGVNTSLSDTASKTGEVSANVADMNANLSEVSSLVTEEQTAFDGLKLKIGEVITAINEKVAAMQAGQAISTVAMTAEMVNLLMLKEKIVEVKESLGEINTAVSTMDVTAVNNLTTSFQALYDKLVLVSTTLGVGIEGQEEGAVSGITSAIEALNNISLEEGIIAQFTNLKTAIDEVSSAIGGGDGTGESGSDSKGGASGSKLGGGLSGGKGSEGESGGGNSLTGAIESMGETAKKVIGEPDAEGDGTVIGEFGSMKTAVNEVSSAIGSGESEGGEGESSGGGEGEDSGNLIGSIVSLGERTQEELGESGGEGVIGKFEELRDVVGEANGHVTGISEALDEIDGKEVECTITVNIVTNGALPAFSTGTALDTMNLNSEEYNAKYGGKAHVEGTALASGNWAVQSNEQSALVGEKGFEIIVRDGRFFTVGDNGAEMTNIKKGDIVFNHEQAVELLKHGHISGRGKAYADGTVGGGKILTKDGHILRPLREGDRGYDLVKLGDAFIHKWKASGEEFMSNAVFEGQKQLEKWTKVITNNTAINSVTNNRNVQPVVNQAFNITMPNVTNATSADALMKDLQSLAMKRSQVKW